MEANVNTGALIFNELEAIQALVIALGYDFENLSLDDVFNLRRDFKGIIETKCKTLTVGRLIEVLK